MAIPGYRLAAPVCVTGDLLLYRATRTKDGLPVLLKIPATPRPTIATLGRLERENEVARDLDSSRIVRSLVPQTAGSWGDRASDIEHLMPQLPHVCVPLFSSDLIKAWFFN
ncbi:unnamed protein product [Sphagnum tenellum]